MSSQSTLLNCLDTRNSGSVSASAGSGKTWLLVSRIVRLLLDKQAPRHIVAITFTRKAAGEMRQRLNERLLQFVGVNDNELDDLLMQISVSPDHDIRRRARSLYDNLLRQTHNVLCTTFHAFCQSLLQSFPLEADITPGFTLVEDSGALQDTAIDSFVNECTQAVDSDLSQSLLKLIDRFGSASVCFTALKGFFHKRLDWQLFTQNHSAVEFAAQTLRGQLSLPDDEYHLSAFFTAQRLHALAEYAQFLGRNSPSDISLALQVQQAITEINNASTEPQFGFEQIQLVLLTQKGEPRKRTASAAQEKRLSGSGQDRFLELHTTLCQDWLNEIELHRRFRNYESNCAWYACGVRLLEIYQQLKADQSVLDFDDLEWHTYQLLFQSDAADWVQYRLDSRIDHILVDEFQDTNHFQWRLLHALLQEMAAAAHDRQRSCFIVGDIKQSIYGFRRAEPALFTSAAHWLKRAMQAQDYPLSTSWRSSPVVMQFVNTVFADARLGLQDFPLHQTHLRELNGAVHILPLVEMRDATLTTAVDTPDEFRNSLISPLMPDNDDRYLREGQRIAEIIKQLTQAGHPSGGGKLRYDEIMILVRSRTHCHHYEKALREANIPYSGGGKAKMFDCLEIQDVLALLECLVTPYKNLSLAQVLRSPIFHCSEHEMQCLVGTEFTWYETLLSKTWSDTEPGLTRAQQLLPQWSQYAARLPTHDAIDHIFHQSDIFRCYQRYAPPHLHGRIRGNLLQVVDMALENDSGRYPSMEKFIWRLQQIKNTAGEDNKESVLLENTNQVKILTIHAAKGLEAKAVFLADAAYSPKDQSTYQACVKWPVDEAQPTHFVLLPSKNERDRVSAQLAQYEKSKSYKEQANLLYVALTRAKQFLYISAVKPNRGDDLAWYGEILKQCKEHKFSNDNGDEGFTVTFVGEKPIHAKSAIGIKENPGSALQHVLRKLPEYSGYQESASNSDYVLPSRLQDDFEHDAHGAEHDPLAATRGTYIHRTLEKLCEGNAPDQIEQILNFEFVGNDQEQSHSWAQEAWRTYTHPDLQCIFNSLEDSDCFSELPISYYDSTTGRFVMGKADRVIVKPDSIHVIDYKSVPLTSVAAALKLSAEYIPQLNAYATGLQQIWPNKPVRRFVLFTALPHLVELTDYA